MKRQSIFFILLLLQVLIICVGCGSSEKSAAPESPAAAAEEAAAVTEEAAETAAAAPAEASFVEEAVLEEAPAETLEEEIIAIGEKPFRAKQLWQWLYFHGQTDFENMTTFSKDLRKKLSENYTITRPKIVAKQVSKDKTCKWLLEFSDGQRVEMVYIPEEGKSCEFSELKKAPLCKGSCQRS